MFLLKFTAKLLLVFLCVLPVASARFPPMSLTTVPPIELFRVELASLQSRDDVCSLPQYINSRVHVGEAGVYMLSHDMLNVVRYMMEQIYWDPTLRAHILAMLKRDLRDVFDPHVVPSEKGGIALRTDYGLQVLDIPSNGRLALYSNSTQTPTGMASGGNFYSNKSFQLPSWARELDALFEGHAHVSFDGIIRQDQDINYNCSPTYQLAKGYGDIVATKELLDEHGITHQVVFALGPNDEVSTVYIGGQKFGENDWYIAVVALPFFWL